MARMASKLRPESRKADAMTAYSTANDGRGSTSTSGDVLPAAGAFCVLALAAGCGEEPRQSRRARLMPYALQWYDKREDFQSDGVMWYCNKHRQTSAGWCKTYGAWRLVLRHCILRYTQTTSMVQILCKQHSSFGLCLREGYSTQQHCSGTAVAPLGR